MVSSLTFSQESLLAWIESHPDRTWVTGMPCGCVVSDFLHDTQGSVWFVGYESTCQYSDSGNWVGDWMLDDWVLKYITKVDNAVPFPSHISQPQALQLLQEVINETA